MKKRYNEEQIIGFLREADKGVPVKELCRKHGISDATFYSWTPPKTAGRIGISLIHSVMLRSECGHGEGNARIF